MMYISLFVKIQMQFYFAKVIVEKDLFGLSKWYLIIDTLIGRQLRLGKQNGNINPLDFLLPPQLQL